MWSNPLQPRPVEWAPSAADGDPVTLWQADGVYREWAATRVAGAVLWSSVRRSGAAPKRVLPDGCMDLIWSADGLLVAGPDTVAQVAATPLGAGYVAIRLPPGTGPAAFGPPADELRDLRVPLADLWSPVTVRRIEERLAETGESPARGGASPVAAGTLGAVLESVILARLTQAGGADPLARAVTARLAAGARVGDVAAGLGLGQRQLHRRCRPLFGYGPKTLARILRLQRALTLVRTGEPAASAAAGSGYADQPHFAREVRALAGVPLGALRDG